jgi:hypothetical protein
MPCVPDWNIQELLRVLQQLDLKTQYGVALEHGRKISKDCETQTRRATEIAVAVGLAQKHELAAIDGDARHSEIVASMREAVNRTGDAARTRGDVPIFRSMLCVPGTGVGEKRTWMANAQGLSLGVFHSWNTDVLPDQSQSELLNNYFGITHSVAESGHLGNKRHAVSVALSCAKF